MRFVWGDDGEGDTADSSSSSSSSSSQQQEVGNTPSCGRVSCLLCQAALNPAAPSLHDCTGTSSSSATTTDSNASPQDRAEESLRLAVEKAMNAAVVRECERCGAGLTKKGGEGACNKVSPCFDSRLFSFTLSRRLLTREVEMHPGHLPLRFRVLSRLPRPDLVLGRLHPFLSTPAGSAPPRPVSRTGLYQVQSLDRTRSGETEAESGGSR